ncbi:MULTISPECIES: ExeM/NucH family extracellular endonuclease [unclassified Pseudoxanthomonas]|uniref:ExeM/NucH family extracellular endonuclease n=1 Tax=unclassified Pseudoxanthomonas TaxID=2645906 RepID=UPI0030785618
MRVLLLPFLVATTLTTGPAAAADGGGAPLAIGAVQGSGDRSPLEGQTVIVEGVVTADLREGLGGFFLQDAGDGDAKTSDGIFVMQALDPAAKDEIVRVGQRVRVEGKVVESEMGRQGSRLTAISPSRIEAITSAAPVTAAELKAIPANWESLEGMKVRISAPLTVTGTDQLDRYGELSVAFDGRLWQPSEVAAPGSPAYQQVLADNARRRLALDDGSGDRDPKSIRYLAGEHIPRAGTVLDGAEGIIDERHGGYRLQTISPLKLTDPQRPAPPTVPGALKIAAFNLENLFNGDGRGGGFPTSRGAKTPQQLQAQTVKLVATIRGLNPDIAALMELENDGYGPESSLAQFVAALNADGGDWRFVDAGQGPGPDTIRVGLIYRASRVTPQGKPAVLEGGPFGERSRVPLAQAFVPVGENRPPVVVVANHFKSKGCSEATGADADQSDGQGCWNALRLDASKRLDAWIKTDPTGSRSDMAVLLGDFNAYAMEDPMRWLRQSGWVDAFVAANVEHPYSYVYNGLSGRLDHALLSPALAKKIRGAAEWHINADESEREGYAESGSGTPYRSSDHDPLLLGFDL